MDFISVWLRPAVLRSDTAMGWTTSGEFCGFESARSRNSQCLPVEKSWQPDHGMWASWRKLCSPVPTVLESICLSASSACPISRGWNCYSASSAICCWTGHTAWILWWTQSISPVCWCLWNPSGRWRKGLSKHHRCVFYKTDRIPGTGDDSESPPPSPAQNPCVDSAHLQPLQFSICQETVG